MHPQNYHNNTNHNHMSILLWSYGSLNRWRKELTKLPRLSTEVLLRSLSSLLTQPLLRLSYIYLFSAKTRTFLTYLWAPRKNSARLAVPAEMSLLLQLLRILTPSKTTRLTLLKTSASVSSSTLEDNTKFKTSHYRLKLFFSLSLYLSSWYQLGLD